VARGIPSLTTLPPAAASMVDGCSLKLDIEETHMQTQHSPVQVMGIDAGGTMTDTFFVREDGSFVVGKAQSNPGDESQAIYESSVDALGEWQRQVDDVFPELLT
jgi:activator of 2-hydroxyglutaryl-CoA dehydratase